MANKKISELPAVSGIDRSELAEVVQGGVNKKATVSQILDAATSSDVGLDQVDNTSDVNKPVSTAQAVAIAAAESDANLYTNTQIANEVLNRNNAIAAAVEGLKWKDSVVVATTANITLSGEQTIDGVLTSTSRVLVKDQTDQTENGIYVSAAGAWARSTDANSAIELEGATVTVQQGTANEDTSFTQITDGVTLGSSNIVWTQLGGSVPLATPSTAGIAKLYTSLGTNTDGSVDQDTLNTNFALKAPLASPTFTGIPAGPTAAQGTNTTQLATTAFIRETLYYVTPEMYGAVGDGVTNDQAAIQSAVDSLRPVCFSDKTYLVSSTVNIPSNAYLFGNGKDSVIKATTAINIFTITGTNATIFNLTFKGNRTASQQGISAIGTGAVPIAPFVTGTKVNLCSFDSLYNGLYTLNSFNPTTYEAAYYVTNCTFSDNSNAGVEFGLAGEYNLVSGCKFFANNYGVYLIGGNQNVTGCSFTNNTAAFRIIGGTNNGKHCITANTINHQVVYSVQATGVTNGFKFEANNVYGGQFYTESCTDIFITGNTFSEAVVSFSSITCTNANWTNNYFLFATTFSITGTPPRFFNSMYAVTQPTTAPSLNTIVSNSSTFKGTTTSGSTGTLRVVDSSDQLIASFRDDGRISIGAHGSPSAISPFAGTSMSKGGNSIGIEMSGNSAGFIVNANQSAAGVAGSGIIVTGSIAHTSGSTAFGAIRDDHVINQTGTASGDYIMFDDNTTLTAILGNLYGIRIKQPTAKNGFGLSTPTATLHVSGTTKLEGSVTLPVAGNGILIKEGSNATMGTATLSGGTITVSTTKVTANSRIFLTVNGGTLTNVGTPYISARTGGTSFTITSTNASDVSDVAWIILEPAP